MNATCALAKKQDLEPIDCAEFDFTENVDSVNAKPLEFNSPPMKFSPRSEDYW